MFLVGHRGIRSKYPENTMPAFLAAYSENIPWIETDVTISKDDVPVIVHDHILGRCSDVKGKNIWNMTYDEIQDIDVGSWFDSRFSSARVPTLSQVVDFINKKKVKCNLEIKGEKENQDRWDRLATSVVNTIQRELDNFDDLLVSSFKIDILKKVHEIDTKIPIGLLVSKEENSDHWQQHLGELPYISVNFEDKIITKDMIDTAHNQNYQVYAWTVNAPSRARQLIDWGIDAIISDCPSEL